MARYYLHLRDRTEETLDSEGLELPDMEAVATAVLTAARDLLSSDLKQLGIVNLRYRIEAENRFGDVVHTLPFKDAIKIFAEQA
jgi:hypothetical protein